MSDPASSDRAADRIVEVAILRIEPDGTNETFHSLIRPEMPIPKAASRVHGLTDDDVSVCPTFAEVAPEVSRMIDGCDLAGFGITSFDLPVLIAEFARVGLPFYISGRKVLDALDIYRRRERRDLTSAVKFYLDRVHEEAHSAKGDVLMTVEVIDAQVGKYGLPNTPHELHSEMIAVDVGGRFLRDEENQIVFGFGKFRGSRLLDIARTDPGYLRWMQSQAFFDDVQSLLRRALDRTREVVTVGG